MGSWSVLRIYLVVAFFLEVHTFFRLYFTSITIAELTPTLPDPILDTIPLVRRLYATYCITLGIVRLAAAINMKSSALLGALTIIHAFEALFSITEVIYYQQITIEKLVIDPNEWAKGGFIIILLAQMLLMGAGFVSTFSHVHKKSD